jgi:DNA-directed RNA polymerase subunit beta'
VKELPKGDIISDGPYSPHDHPKIKRYSCTILTLLLTRFKMFIDFKECQLMISILNYFKTNVKKSIDLRCGDTKFIQGDQVSYAELKEENEKIESAGKNPAEFERVLLELLKHHLLQIHLFQLHLSKKLLEY